MSESGHNLVKIGQALRTNDASGEFVMGFDGISPDEVDIQEPVFIYFDGTPVPFFIENIAPKGVSKAVVKLSDIDSQEDAQEIRGAAVYVRAESLGEIADDEDDLSFIVGWTLCDCESGPQESTIKKGGRGKAPQIRQVGEIIDFLDIPGNPCIIVSCPTGEVTIPLHEDLVVSMDPEEKVIIMTIPSGLL